MSTDWYRHRDSHWAHITTEFSKNHFPPHTSSQRRRDPGHCSLRPCKVVFAKMTTKSFLEHQAVVEHWNKLVGSWKFSTQFALVSLAVWKLDLELWTLKPPWNLEDKKKPWNYLERFWITLKQPKNEHSWIPLKPLELVETPWNDPGRPLTPIKSHSGRPLNLLRGLGSPLRQLGTPATPLKPPWTAL